MKHQWTLSMQSVTLKPFVLIEIGNHADSEIHFPKRNHVRIPGSIIHDSYHTDGTAHYDSPMVMSQYKTLLMLYISEYKSALNE